ncbi:LysR family transcriptional regulator [Nocardia cyriacigeorgica]|uniref:LysR family transcriptional regulator n=1 Tax=Nocardia cyriacigeorgica TaxID=135487 RepID=A0A6P1DBQ2_9NOCA|nr:LysR family transcriptional regulator [Nocardia cyriacigeorgica]NEW45762.1 LysR family transcriptional regulator [Nocardia cyriacigeorgica]
MDVDTRLLRYFVVVADEGNLSRAAERLYVSQPSLTKQIRRLEELLGVPLFVRSRAGMTLTEPGQVLARSVPLLLVDWQRAVTEVKTAAAEQDRVLRVGFLASAANEATPDIIGAFGELRPGWRVEMRQSSWGDPTAGLAAGDVDAALLRVPFPGQESWRIEVLLTEPRGVMLPSTHPLAGADTIAFHQLWDEPFIAAVGTTGEWRDYWLATSERQGHPVRIGAVTEHTDEWLSAIANGYGVALAPESSGRYFQRPGVVYRPVTGIPSTQVAVAWDPATGAASAVHDFIASCLRFRQE